MAKTRGSFNFRLVSVGVGSLVIAAIVIFVVTHHETITLKQEGVVFLLMTIVVGLILSVCRDIERDLKDHQNRH